MSRVGNALRATLRRVRVRYVLAGCAVVAVLAVLWWVATLATQVNSLSRALDVQRQQAVQAGQSPAVPDSGQIRKDPAQPLPSPGQKGDKGDQGPGPSDAQVQAAVTGAFGAHPEWIKKGIDPAVLGAFVVNYLQAHPPKNGKDGKPPTAEQISAAVLAQLQANPPSPGPSGPSGPPGQKGEKGDQGPGPTDQQVADSVASWFQSHPLPNCPAGTTAQAHHVLVDDDGDPLTHETADAVLCVLTGGSPGSTG
jgi:hypothetical protein